MLADHQRGVLDLLKGRAAAPGDPYITRLAGSEELVRLREISIWWCAYGIRSSCPWTARLLDRRGIFDSSIAAFFESENISPYIETSGRQFLARLCAHPDPLVAALAGFELAVSCVQRGHDDEFVVEWDRDPNAVMRALRTGDDIPPAEAGRVYRLRISRAFPELLHCERIDLESSVAAEIGQSFEPF